MGINSQIDLWSSFLCHVKTWLTQLLFNHIILLLQCPTWPASASLNTLSAVNKLFTLGNGISSCQPNRRCWATPPLWIYDIWVQHLFRSLSLYKWRKENEWEPLIAHGKTSLYYTLRKMSWCNGISVSVDPLLGFLSFSALFSLQHCSYSGNTRSSQRSFLVITQESAWQIFETVDEDPLLLAQHFLN